VVDVPVLLGTQSIVGVQHGGERRGYAVVVGEVGSEEDVVDAGESGQRRQRVATRQLCRSRSAAALARKDSGLGAFGLKTTDSSANRMAASVRKPPAWERMMETCG
jgi:hypothetical protein